MLSTARLEAMRVQQSINSSLAACLGHFTFRCRAKQRAAATQQAVNRNSNNKVKRRPNTTPVANTTRIPVSRQARHQTASSSVQHHILLSVRHIYILLIRVVRRSTRLTRRLPSILILLRRSAVIDIERPQRRPSSLLARRRTRRLQKQPRRRCRGLLQRRLRGCGCQRNFLRRRRTQNRLEEVACYASDAS